jgi:hypothetical protein
MEQAMENKIDRKDESGVEGFVGGIGLNRITNFPQPARHPRTFLSGIQNLGWLEAGFPIRTVSGMTGVRASVMTGVRASGMTHLISLGRSRPNIFPNNCMLESNL